MNLKAMLTAAAASSLIVPGAMAKAPAMAKATHAKSHVAGKKVAGKKAAGEKNRRAKKSRKNKTVEPTDTEI